MTDPLTCMWCNAPMTSDILGDGAHPGCDGPPATAAPSADAYGPCAICGESTIRYGEHADSTLCGDCLPVVRS